MARRRSRRATPAGRSCRRTPLRAASDDARHPLSGTNGPLSRRADPGPVALKPAHRGRSLSEDGPARRHPARLHSGRWRREAVRFPRSTAGSRRWPRSRSRAWPSWPPAKRQVSVVRADFSETSAI